jgi:hypothetical protein
MLCKILTTTKIKNFPKALHKLKTHKSMNSQLTGKAGEELGCIQPKSTLFGL